MHTDKVYVIYFLIKYQYYNTREISVNKQAAYVQQSELHLCCENTF